LLIAIADLSTLVEEANAIHNNQHSALKICIFGQGHRVENQSVPICDTRGGK
jgi:hypothetical protein